jgi:hypothetical protein
LQVNDLRKIGPVRLRQVGFDPGASFEGRIADELARLEGERTIRVLGPAGRGQGSDSEELVVLELLALYFDGDDSFDAAREGEDEHSFGLASWEIEEMGASLPSGGSAALVLIEHVWARGLKRAVRDAGGTSLGESFVTPEAVAAIEPKLAAISRAVRATE